MSSRMLVGVTRCAFWICLLAAPGHTWALDPKCQLGDDHNHSWLPTTPEPNETEVPLPKPSTDCAFYVPAWQRFLFAMQPNEKGLPRFLTYPSFDDIFNKVEQPASSRRSSRDISLLALLPRKMQRANSPTEKHRTLLETTQAAAPGNTTGGALIDQNGHFVYYQIHVDPFMESFIRLYNLTSATSIRTVQAALAFQNLQPPFLHSVVEYKSAWMIVDDPDHAKTYYVTRATIPRYAIGSDGLLIEEVHDGKPVTRKVWAALIALHVVFTLPGHPEMIWSTFEHVQPTHDGTFERDNAPAATANPSDQSDSVTINETFPLYPLFKAHTPASQANLPIFEPKEMAKKWNAAKQAFMQAGQIVSTSVYRPFPASKSDPQATTEDEEVVALNGLASDMFKKNQAQLSKKDRRPNYRLVGATWLDRPVDNFKTGQSFDGDMVAGEDRLGSTAMESFTEAPDVAPNCFSCHDTTTNRSTTPPLPEKLLNVSHLFSKYLIDSAAPQPGMSK